MNIAQMKVKLISLCYFANFLLPRLFYSQNHTPAPSSNENLLLLSTFQEEAAKSKARHS